MTSFIKIKNFALAALISTLFVVGAMAQAGTGGIAGSVTDATGAVVPSATVTLTNKATNQTQTQTTSDDGLFRFVTLQPGTYDLKTTATNFAEQTKSVEVQVGRVTDANFTLGAGDVAAEVTVTAEGVQTTQSNSDAVISEAAISNLPINGRRFQDFVTLTPTAQVEGSRGQISLSGQRGINSNVNVDGVDFNQPFFGGIRGGERSNQAFTIPQESIKEFQVIAAGYNAEFGRSSGGIVNAVTKSGSNDLRGSLFYLWRPEQLARGNEFTDDLQARLPAGVDVLLAPTQHQFGGSIGGPIVKDRLFFFGSYEQQRFRAPRQVLVTALDAITLPAGDRGLEAYNFLESQEESFTQTNDAYAALGRIDWVVNDAHRLNARYSFSRNDAENAAATGETVLDPTTNNALSANGFEKNRNNIFVGQFVSNFGANLINDLRGQYAKETRPRIANAEEPNVFFGNAFAQYGSRNFLPTTQYDTRHQIADSLTWLTGNHTFKFGGEYSRLYANQEFGFNQFGAYSLSSGGNTTILRNVSLPTAAGTYLGRFDDTNARYNRQIGNRQTEFAVHELSFFGQDSWRITPRFTLNYGLRVEQQYNPTPETTNTTLVNVVQNTAFPMYGGKGFDPTQLPDSGWQWGPRFGFAWDPTGESKTVIRGFGGVYYARTPLLIFADTVNNFRATPGNVSTQLPFTGFSQSAFNNWINTTPAGATYRTITGCDTAGTGNALAACTPNTVYRQFATIGINLNSFGLGQLPDVTPEQISQIAGNLGLTANPFVGAQVTGHAADFKNPQSYQAGFAVEHEMWKNFIVGLDYAFVRTIHLQRNRDINLPGPLTGQQYLDYLAARNPTTFANLTQANRDLIVQSGRTYIAVVNPGGVSFPSSNFTATRLRPTADPLAALNGAARLGLGSVQVRESSASSLYNALTFRMRMVRSWVQVNAYYTLSRNKSDDDNERDSGGVAYANPYDLTGEWGPSRLDRTHQFTANPVFFLPYGFEVSSAIRLRSGTPLSTYIGTDANGDNIFNDRPILVPGVELPRNYFRNRATYDVDLRVQKGFRFDETKRLVFTAEFFNIFNTPNILFAFPGTNSTSGPRLQYCVNQTGQPAVSTPLCGLYGVQNPNFLQIRDQTGVNAGRIASEVVPGSQVFQVQLGARFNF